jgi:hypothetical protein
VDTTARDLADAYHDNELGADRQFKGKVLRIFGRFDQTKREGEHVALFLYGDKERHDLDPLEPLRVVACDYIGEEKLVADLHHGYKVTAHALGAGATGGLPLLAECVIEPR